MGRLQKHNVQGACVNYNQVPQVACRSQSDKKMSEMNFPGRQDEESSSWVNLLSYLLSKELRKIHGKQKFL